MKTKILLFIVLFIISFGCKEEKKDPINYDDVWLAQAMLDENPKILFGDPVALMQRLQAFVKKQNEGKDIKRQSENASFEYHVMLNKNGKMDRLSIEKSNDPIIDSIVIAEINLWKFKPGIRKGNDVNSIYILNILLDLSNNLPPVNEGTYFVTVENMPEPLGGIKAIQEKIVYPEIAKRAGIEGKVFVLAFIDEKGNVANAKIIKGIGAGCDEAALNAVMETKFAPGKQRGTPVKTQVSIPIVFKL